MLLVVVVVVLLRALFLFGVRFWFGVVFWVGVRFEVEENPVSEVRGHLCWVGGVRGVVLGCRGCLCGGRGAFSSLACGCSFGLGRGFVDAVRGGGGRRRWWRRLMRMRTRRKWWFFGDVGRAVMRAGAALWATAASTAATAGRMEGMSSGWG